MYDILIRINLDALLSILQMLIHHTPMTVYFWTLLEKRDVTDKLSAT